MLLFPPFDPIYIRSMPLKPIIRVPVIMAVTAKKWDDVSPPLEEAIKQSTKPDTKTLWYNRFYVNYMSPREFEEGFWQADVKGNFRHRLALCGVDEALTEDHEALRHFAVEQYGNTNDNPGRRWKSNGFLAGPERPDWSNGCQCYLTPEDYLKLRGMVQTRAMKLQSKHIVASNVIMPTVVAALSTPPAQVEANRDYYLYRRVAFRDLVWYSAPDYEPHKFDLSALPVE